MIEYISQLVEVFDDRGDPVLALCVQKRLTEEELYMPQDFEAFLPPAGKPYATVRREVTETIGGPGYSSVRVSTSIELHCAQKQETIAEASRLALAECSILTEEGVLQAFDGLLQHRKVLGLSE